jgi:hypothetical protein
MAELVDAQVSDTCVERRAGSSPVLGTIQFVAQISPCVFYNDYLVFGANYSAIKCENIADKQQK